MPLDFLRRIRLLKIPLLFLRKLLPPRRQRLVNPLSAAEPDNRALHALHRPRQRHLRHCPALLLRELLDAVDDCHGLGARGGGARRAGGGTFNLEGAGELAFCEGTPLDDCKKEGSEFSFFGGEMGVWAYRDNGYACFVAEFVHLALLLAVQKVVPVLVILASGIVD